MWCALSLLAPNAITAISRGGELFAQCPIFVYCWFCCTVLAATIINEYYCYLTTQIVNNITEVSIFYADKLMVMGNSKNSRVFNFAILLCDSI